MSEGIRALLLQERFGVLATLAAGRDGWPYASIVAYSQTERHEPLLLLSDLAEHTRNLSADARASLLVHDHTSAESPLAGARVTLLGTVEAIGADDLTTAQERYLARHPQAVDLFQLGDFRMYVLRPREARFIGGFGDMGWVDSKELTLI
jgi:putative heme iron utilization protein